MTTILDSIDTVYPSNETTGVPLNSSIQIVFDREIDEWSLEHGGLVVEGPDTDQVIYPGYTPTTLVAGTESEILQSPGLKGVVAGTFSFQRLSLSNTSIVNTSDTTGDGTLFRTKVLFKPSQPLKALTEYRVYVVGDDDDTDEITGVRTRTVFDPVEGANAGDGHITFSGTYLGSFSQDTLNIRITKSGVAGVAEFEAWSNNQPLDVVGPFLTSSTEAQVLEGITAQFLDGTFQVDDTFTVIVKRPTTFTDTATFTFTTGNGSINVVPTSTATSITGDPAPLASGLNFTIVKTSPDDGDTNLNPSIARQIVVEFSDDIDPATISSETVQVLIEPVSDHPLLTTQVTAGPITNTLTVSGHKLFIDL